MFINIYNSENIYWSLEYTTAQNMTYYLSSNVECTKKVSKDISLFIQIFDICRCLILLSMYNNVRNNTS